MWSILKNDQMKKKFKTTGNASEFQGGNQDPRMYGSVIQDQASQVNPHHGLEGSIMILSILGDVLPN